MKKMMITLMSVVLLAISMPVEAAMSLSEVRQNARFLSDRMAYELNLNTYQYNDVYEINYDFLSCIRYLMDDVVLGDGYAIDRYYEFLDLRNEDLSYVLSRNQYLRFADREYFYRPIYTGGNRWHLRIYGIYSNVGHFYFSLPVNFYTYNGLHSRVHYHKGFYKGRYRHDRYRGPLYSIRKHDSYADHRWHDFKAPLRPGKAPSRYDPSHSGNHVRPHQQMKPGVGNKPNAGNKPSVKPNRNDSPTFHVGSRPGQQTKPTVRPNQGSVNKPNGTSSSVRYNSKESKPGRSKAASVRSEQSASKSKQMRNHANSGNRENRRDHGASRR